MPLIISHGYPGSFSEFADIIGPLTNPRAHGGDPADAFHVVAPSLPGFGFSTPVREPGWAVGRTAKAYAELMRELGYDRYGAQGGDIGAGVVGALGGIDPTRVVGVHVNSDPMAITWLLDNMPVDLSKLSESDRSAVDAIRARAAEGKGYLQLQSTRPQTIGYSLNDLPVGQLAWIVEKFEEWTDLAGKLSGPADRSRPAPHQCQPLLVQRERRIGGAVPLRSGSFRRRTGAPLRRYRKAGRSSPRNPSCGGSSTRRRRSRTGRSSTRAGILPPWRHPTSWSRISGDSSVASAKRRSSS